jgi:glutamyl-tRNA reductase
MVVGETEIFGQIKRAYRFATGAKTTGRVLNRLFQESFRVGKQVRSSTAITRGSVSIGSVAVELAEQIYGDLQGRKIMIVGAGKTSEKAAKAFRSRGAEQIFVSNRSFGRAQALALRKQESEKAYQLIEFQVQELQSWMDRTQDWDFPSIVVLPSVLYS